MSDGNNSDDTDDEIELYSIKENKIPNLENNQIFTEDIYYKIIENLHNSLKIYNSDLLNIIDNCATKNILNYSLIKLIANCTNKYSQEGEVITNLKELYTFLLEPDFNEGDFKFIREIIKNNLKEENLNNTNFKIIINNIKVEIIIKKLKIKDDYIINIIKNCVGKKWTFQNIKIFENFLKPLYSRSLKGLKKEKLDEVKAENEYKIHISQSVLDIVDAFPVNNILDKTKNIIFDNLPNVARDFYINCAYGKNDKKKLDVQELFNTLQKKNKNYFDENKINQFREKIEICQKIYKKMNPQNINKWIKNDFNDFFKKENNKYQNIAETIGVIFSGFKKKMKDFILRETQILSILIFIDNYENQGNFEEKDQKGIIEEIATGEGKSIIICCLATYFGLLEHKVDIITSSNTLAEREVSESKSFYELFNLKVDICKDKKFSPYHKDIVYGTFLSFEGDLLEEIVNNNKTRGKRPYDIIIIDEVDNAFIDCIEGSTQLTQSSKGYQFLIPMYISIYFFIDILDNIYLEEVKKEYEKIVLKEEYKNLSEDSKKKVLDKLSEDSDRKDIFTNYIENFFRDILKKVNEEEIKNQKNIENKKEENEIEKQKNENEHENIIQALDDNSKLKNFFRYPYFLKDFVEYNLKFWINSAFTAKNEMHFEKDYTLSSKRYGYKTITPIDRKNTGELEFDTIYKKGLHQMLEIKEKVRVSSQTLDCTYMSHIYYFSLFKQKKNFFGLTGTIGGEETFKIYKSKYFNSNLIFIPSYMSKRFIELPPIICKEDYEKHLIQICKEIIFEYSKGRKILVICKDIKEGNDITKMLQEREFIPDNDNFLLNNSYKKDIFQYLRNDADNMENELNMAKKRIIISTNLGGRGTDIKTTDKEEENGGLHVIITKLSKNSRTQKQAFGRTSRKGNKGSGQYICTEKKKLKTYNQLLKDRDEKEKNFINNINLDYLIYKDNLFQKYIHFIHDDLNQRGEDNYLKSDIDEKWAFFLNENVENDIDEKKINASFDLFQKNIKGVMKLHKNEIFNNNFLGIYHGINKYKKFEQELKLYLNFDNNSQCFYFASSYYNARIAYEKHKSQFESNINDPKYCNLIVKYLKKTKKKLKKLIEINIEPVLKSFVDWEKISKLDKLLQGTEDNSSANSFITQFENRKLIVKKLIEIIEDNINIVNEYINKYLPKNKIGYEVILEVEDNEIEKSLNLGEKYKLDINEYIKDAGLIYSFKFIIKKKIIKSGFIYRLKFLGFFILFTIFTMAAPLIAIGASYFIFKAMKDYFKQSENEEYVDVHEYNSLFSLIRSEILSIFEKSDKKEANIIQNNNYVNKIEIKEFDDDKLTSDELKKFQKKLNKEIENNINKALNKNMSNILEEIKFLLFVDLLLEQNKWKEIIRNIIIDYFNNDERFEQKSELIKMCARKSGHSKAIEKLKSVIEESVKNIINKIKEKFDSDEYNENEIKRLEHIIIRQSFGNINQDSASKITEQIFAQNIINKDGKFNKELFEKEENKKDKKNKKNKNEKKEVNEDKVKKIQKIKINYNTPYPGIINNIKTINDFSLKLNFDLNLEKDNLIQDVQILYLTQRYKNFDELLKMDFSNRIKDLLIQMYDLSMIDLNEEIKELYIDIKIKIFEIITTYLKEEIYPNILIVNNKKINMQLNPEEQKVYKLITENSGKKAIELLKSKKIFK